jgi:hypothetical protein
MAHFRFLVAVILLGAAGAVAQVAEVGDGTGYLVVTSKNAGEGVFAEVWTTEGCLIDAQGLSDGQARFALWDDTYAVRLVNHDELLAENSAVRIHPLTELAIDLAPINAEERPAAQARTPLRSTRPTSLPAPTR